MHEKSKSFGKESLLFLENEEMHRNSLHSDDKSKSF